MASTSQSEPNTLDLDVLKVIEVSIKNGSLTYVQEDMLDGLKLTALESLSDQKDVQDFINRKYYALKCLRLLPLELSNDFCLTFYNELEEIMSLCCPEFEESEGFYNLQNYIDSSTVNEKLHLMETIALCLAENNINYSVFEKIPPNEWRKELLVFILFRGCTDFDSVQRVINKINKLTDSEGGAYIVENVLEILVNNRHGTSMDIQFINDVFFVAAVHPHFLAMLSFDYANVTEMIKQVKMNNLLDRYGNVPGYEMHIQDFPFFLKYPLDVIQAICAEKKMFKLSDLIDLKRILESCDIDLAVQIKLLLRIDPSKTMDKWKYEVSFEIVKSTISEIFSEYENYFRQINYSDPTINCINNTLTIKCTCLKKSTECLLHHSPQCCQLLYVLNKTLARVIFNCSNYSEKVLQTIDIILVGINEAQHIVSVINGLEIIEDYNIQFTDVELLKFFLILPAEDYERKIHEYVVEHSFPGTYEKSVDQLLSEIEEMNPDLTRKIIEQYLNVISCYENKSVLFPENRAIEFWDQRQIERWGRVFRFINNGCTDPLLGGLKDILDPTRELRNNLHTFASNVEVTDEEILAVIKRAAKVTVGLDLRTVQVLSVLIMINSDKGKGRLAQVNTGEGKTLIIAILAAFNVFKGHKVDVFTSSPVLAIPQSEEFEQFYSACGISVAHNIFQNAKYGSDVIYGTNHSFQRDVLSDEFRKSGVRKKRLFDVAIVDEVDNMLIDGNNWILQLTCDMPAMDYLEVILAAIYIQVKEAASLLVERNGEVFYLSQDNAIDEEGNVLPEVNVEEVPLACTKREFIIQCTESHIRKLIRDTDHCGEIDKNYPEIKIPEHLREVILKVQLKKWIERAVQAIFVYVKGEDYIIKDGKITIVDADNTGVVKRDSHWSAGLHQFLEIKHGARVQQESFTTNYISNVGLFTRYTTKLYGLTGTLGSEETRGFLQTTYDVDSVIIPPFKLKQHLNMKAIIVDNQKAKYIEIARSCIRKLKNGRAVLIIMKYIKETDELADVFTKLFYYDASKVKLFKTDEDSHIVEKSLKPGDVIITTNIAGRGTDLKLSKDVEQNGGLHVCLTFLPVNSRVEQQNIGRTSRKGNRGTSQLVLYDANDNNIEVIKDVRGKQEKRIMKGASDDVKKIKTKDRIFKLFCDLLSEIKCRNTDTKKIELKGVEERFAIWLIMNEQKLENDGEIFKEFDSFKNQILEDDRRDSLLKNPYMYVAIGNDYLDKKKFEEAIMEYSTAIALDHHFAEHAYFNRAWAYIGKYGHNIEEYSHFIDEAINDLKKARKLIQDKEYSLHLLQTASKSEVFSEQINHKFNLYSVEKNSIDLAIGPDKDAIEEQLKKLEEEDKCDTLTTEYREKLKEAIEKLKECKKDIGVIGRAKSRNRNIKIESLEDNYMPEEDKKSHKEEIQEFSRNGWMGGFKITEVKPIDWTTVISLLGIGLGQLLIGAALTVFTLGAGATIGMALISEGISDIITAVKDGIINRDFDWATWALMKVISITISIVCAGFKAIKDAARTAYTGVKNVATSGAKAFTQVTKDGWKIVAKKVGVDLAKGVAKNIVTDLVTYGIDKTILPMIEEAIIEKVRVPIQEALMNNAKVTKMLKLDEKNKNHKYENKIRKLAQKMLTPENQSKLGKIAKQIATQVADNKGLALTRQVCNGLYGIYELTTFTSNFIKDMNLAIAKIEIDKNSTENASGSGSSQQNNDTEYANATQHNTSEKERNHDADEIDLNKINQEDEQVKLKKKVHTTDNLSTEISGMVSTNLMRILKGDIISPLTQMGVNYSIDKLSSRVNNSLENDMKNYRALKNVIHYQSKGYKSASNQQQTDTVRKVDAIIDDLKNGGPAGLVHLGAISDATDRPIEVYDEKGNHKYTIGDNKKAAPIKIQHHSRGDGEVGHFTLLGGKEPHSKATGSNNCVFNCIADQTGLDPNVLKNKTIKIMESNKSTIAKQVTHIDRLEMYNRSSLLEGGAQYDGKNPDDALRYLRNSNGVIAFKGMYPGHADKHIPFRGKTRKKLEVIAEKTGRPIEVYNTDGQLAYIVGDGDAPPIKLEYHKAQGSDYSECFLTKGGNDKPYILADSDNAKLYEIVGKQTGHKAQELKSSVELQLNSETVPPGHCIENETKLLKRKKQAFESEQEQAYVLHHALETEKAKLAMEELNRYKEGVNDAEQFYKNQITITAEELNLPRPAYGGDWNKGTAKVKWPVRDVRLVLQHYNGSQNDPNAPVHILTFYPIAPKMN